MSIKRVSGTETPTAGSSNIKIESDGTSEGTSVLVREASGEWATMRMVQSISFSVVADEHVAKATIVVLCPILSMTGESVIVSEV